MWFSDTVGAGVLLGVFVVLVDLGVALFSALLVGVELVSGWFAGVLGVLGVLVVACAVAGVLGGLVVACAVAGVLGFVVVGVSVSAWPSVFRFLLGVLLSSVVDFLLVNMLANEP